MKKRVIDKQGVGNRIKSIRLSYGWTLKQFSTEISRLLSDDKEIAEGIISRWENGISLPNRERMKAISRLGKMTVDELLYGSFKDNIVSLLIMFEIMLKNDKSVPTELHDSILKSLKNRYIDSNGNLIEDWYYYDSLEDLIKSFNDYGFRIIEMAKQGTLKEETILSSLIHNVENAFSDFLDYYNLAKLNSNDKSETSNSPKDILNEELKDKVTGLTLEYLNKLNDIHYHKVYDEMNNNQ